MNAFVSRFSDDATFINTLFAEILCYSKTVQKPNLLVQRLVPSTFDKAISSFRLQQFSSLSKPREDYPFSSWPDIISHSERSEKDASIVASLYRQLVRDDLDKAGQLLEKIANDTASIHQDDLDRFVIPLLCEMIDILERQPSKAAPFYSKVISTYIERTVQEEPPKPQDWSLPDDVRECYWADCTYCPVVREFLGNPSRDDWDFTISEDRYYDFTRHLPFHYTTTKEKRGEHYDIKVTKSLKTWEREHEAWRGRFERAQSALRRLPESSLRRCLGDGEYQDLMGLQIVKLPTADVATDPPNSAQAEAAGKGKRKRRRL